MRKTLAVAFSMCVLFSCLSFSASAFATDGGGAIGSWDCNGDGSTDLSDVICLLSWLFLGSTTLLAPMDVNGDGKTDIADAVCLLGMLFLGLSC